jgi:hypothetical protein
LEVADIDGDGDLDVLVATASNGSTHSAYNAIYINDGGGELWKATEGDFVTEEMSSTDLEVVDIDGDSDLDVLVANDRGFEAGGIVIYINDGVGELRKRVLDCWDDNNCADGNWIMTVSNPRGLELADIDGDGDLDVLIINFGERNAMYINKGGGELRMLTDGDFVTDTAVSSTDLEVVDIDGDGDLDVLVTKSKAMLAKFKGGDQFENNAMYVNEGTGELTKVMEGVFVTDLAPSHNLHVVDIDGDGDLDVLVANGGNNAMYMNEGGCAFRKLLGGDFITDSGISTSLDVVDIDGDGYLDVLVANSDPSQDNQNNAMYKSDSLGEFRKLLEGVFVSSDGGFSIDLEVADIDNDGDLDVLSIVRGEDTSNVIYMNDGGSELQKWTEGASFTDNRPTDLEVVDIDGDGDLDIVVANNGADFADTRNSIYFNEGGCELRKETEGAFQTEGGRLLEIGDIDGDGDLDIISGTLFINDGAGVSIHHRVHHTKTLTSINNGGARGTVEGVNRFL